MQGFELFRPEGGAAKASRWRGGASSVGIHAAALAVALGLLHGRPRVAPFVVPGTKTGIELLSYYTAGSVAHAPSEATSLKKSARDATKLAHPPLAAPAPAEKPDATGETGTANSLVSGQGSGEISLALEKYFPYPKPDLSSLPHGTRGDVILDAVVDENGKITDLTLVQGLGPAIDNVVIATVKEWSYIPATRHGVPVPSKQELHFHYERG